VGLAWVAIATLLLVAIVFVGMARMILGVVYGQVPDGASSLRESLPIVAGPVTLAGLVLMLGLHLPGPLQTVLAEAARSLGGVAP